MRREVEDKTAQNRAKDVRSTTMSEDERVRCQCSYKNHRKKRPGLGSRVACVILCHSAVADKCLSAWARGPTHGNVWVCKAGAGGRGVGRCHPNACRQVPQRDVPCRVYSRQSAVTVAVTLDSAAGWMLCCLVDGWVSGLAWPRQQI